MAHEPNAGFHRTFREGIGRAVEHYRREAGLSLAELAERSSIGKSTLYELESGHANPSIETLWAVAVQLGVGFGQLVDPYRSRVQTVRAAKVSKVPAETSALNARLLTSAARIKMMETYILDLEPDEHYRSSPHNPGSEEHVVVISGSLMVGPEEEPVELADGDAAIFPGDVPHIYSAIGTVTRAFHVMIYR